MNAVGSSVRTIAAPRSSAAARTPSGASAVMTTQPAPASRAGAANALPSTRSPGNATKIASRSTFLESMAQPRHVRAGSPQTRRDAVASTMSDTSISIMRCSSLSAFVQYANGLF